MTDIPDLGPEDHALLAALAELPPVEPIPGGSERFRARVAVHRIVHRGPSGWVVAGLAAVLILMLAGGWQIDRRRQEAEAGRLRAQLALALRDLSAVTRVQAITAAGMSGIHDTHITDALVSTLLHDANPNVRVAAAEALGQIGGPASMAALTVTALAREESPFVQAALLAIVRTLAPADRAAAVRALLAQDNVDQSIRAEATGLSTL